MVADVLNSSGLFAPHGPDGSLFYFAAAVAPRWIAAGVAPSALQATVQDAGPATGKWKDRR
jgi:hypothetical protein